VKETSIYKEHREKVIYLFTLVGVLSTSFFAVLNVLIGKESIAIIEFWLSFLAILNVIYFKKKRNFDLASTNILIIVYLVLIALIIDGGYRNQGIFWIYVFPILTFFLKNKKTALLWNLFYLLSMYSLMILSEKGIIKIAYNQEIIFEATASYAAVSFLAYFYSSVLNSLIEELNYRAIYDTLTQVYNREYVYDYLEREIERIKRGYKQHLCLIYIDLDNFKYVNDNYGHSVGDSVLKEAARIFIENFRKTDVIGRFGGDEFLIIVSDCRKKFIDNKSKLVRKNFEEKFKKYHLSFSYGIILIPEESVDIKEAIKLADTKMYENKIKRKRLRQEPSVF